ncbi:MULTISPECIES: 1-hydroxy-2-glutathionyl-2-methyl-3-butene dehydrogenase [unclassified Nocardioides]|uniref:1-hydroxy-2-glutathionyl-2-methyl-3-butene dehydrogenase n=1 Tax=unclassified Nocardioides TaxID=2615069 RepID=UPI0006F30464|nr:MULTISPECIES: SDR family oxidoreductase [unclassified Nocardioides]KRA30001.1 1-hydroxy-2-glutathionyl-2-methyl-3-butene dehydrogenase [Nocardioides sp. Root614]KRA86921.1 1-hydroxy-2-glutathionyl-2-methyl-3-butene dehydrogenase [Nocardioides sp. Root682]
MPTKVIIGADRGIARSIAEQLHAAGDDVLAVTMGDGSELAASGIAVESGINVTSDDAVDQLVKRLSNDNVEIEWLVHVAGVMYLDNIDTVDYDDVRKQFEINTIGPLRVVRALRGFLVDGGKVGILTSRVGSMNDNTSGGDYAYRISKAAANMVALNLHHDLSKVGVAVQALHPGMVNTGLLDAMTDEDRERAASILVTPQQAASNLISVLGALTVESGGKFQHANGDILPW